MGVGWGVKQMSLFLGGSHLGKTFKELAKFMQVIADHWEAN